MTRAPLFSLHIVVVVVFLPLSAVCIEQSVTYWSLSPPPPPVRAAVVVVVGDAVEPFAVFDHSFSVSKYSSATL